MQKPRYRAENKAGNEGNNERNPRVNARPNEQTEHNAARKHRSLNRQVGEIKYRIRNIVSHSKYGIHESVLKYYIN